MPSVIEELRKTLELVQLERREDLEQYRQKVLLTPLHRKTQEGKCWYPVRMAKHYIGTGERLIIEVERTQQLGQPHVFQSGKVVSLFSNAQHKPERDHVGGVINYVRDNTMVITLNPEELPDWIESPHLGVDVMFDEMSYREMEYAMKEVIKAEAGRVAELRDILLGVHKASFLDPPPALDLTENVNLNDSQRQALVRALSAREVGIIHGPPGTGKTTTLAQAIRLAVKEEGQVLVCAPSNAAVDLLTEKCSELGLRVLRIGHPARVTEQSLSKTLDARIAAHDHFKELRSLRKRMEQLKDMAYRFKRNFGYQEREQRKLLLRESKSVKSDADMLEFYIVNDLLQNSEVITCTLVGSSHPLLKGRRFKTVFIDEAAQSLEPACWIPLLKAERVILAGDHHQLPPTIKSIAAAKAGLAQTLFEKCIARQPHAATMLQVQYRMNASIMKFPSVYFYSDALVAHASVRDHALPGHSEPFVFIDTAGCGYGEGQDEETLSRFNEEEGALLIREVSKLVGDHGPDWDFTIGIITPYQAQAERLRKRVGEDSILSSLSGLVSVNTVDAFQGQERDVVAISMVRSNDKGEVGFLADIRRTNVAMTRARKKLLMVGDSATLGNHPFYGALIEFVQDHGFYHSAWEFVET